MITEELKREGIKYACDYPTSYGKGYKRVDLRKSYVAGAEPREKRIADLEKEKAELKEQNKNYEQLIENGSVTLVKERLKNYKQLIKAKKNNQRVQNYS